MGGGGGGVAPCKFIAQRNGLRRRVVSNFQVNKLSH